MCGPAGSGKSTMARQLEAEGIERLSFDDEAWRRGIRSMPLLEDVHLQIEEHLRERLINLVKAGVDVVLDFSFWSRQMRDDYRRLLKPFGVEPETIYLATPREVALARISERAAAHADDLPLTEDLAAAYFDNFEVPSPDEGPLTVVA
jgi:predicted kinase